MISKNFHHVLRISERQPLIGPPESMREHVVQASKAMKRGEWRACRDYLINDKMNLKVPRRRTPYYASATYTLEWNRLLC